MMMRFFIKILGDNQSYLNLCHINIEKVHWLNSFTKLKFVWTKIIPTSTFKQYFYQYLFKTMVIINFGAHDGLIDSHLVYPCVFYQCSMIE